MKINFTKEFKIAKEKTYWTTLVAIATVQYAIEAWFENYATRNIQG